MQTTEADPAIVLTRIVAASCAAVFKAWTDPVLLQRWLAPGANVVDHAETDLRVGGTFRLETRSPDGSRHRITGRYEVIEPDRRLVQTWIYEGPLDLLAGEETLLEIKLRLLGERSTELRLTHRRLCRADIREGYRGDGPSCFDKLDRVLN